MKPYIFIFLLLLHPFIDGSAQSWAEKTLQQLSCDEKIAQLLIVAVVSDVSLNKDFILRAPYSMDPTFIKKIIKEHQIGGIIFLGNSNPAIQKIKTGELQKESAIPLLIFQDLEWGLAMRHAGELNFPKALTLGALVPANEQLIYHMGREIARQAQLIGVHGNLAPVMDVNTNPLNPVIGMRSFGDNPENVTRKSLLYAQGMRDQGLLCCAKHFPGHGDTATDSHWELPVILHSKERLTTKELVSFKKAADSEIPLIMSAHLRIPALDNRDRRIATNSELIIKKILRDEWHYEGLIITDGLGMKGVTNLFSPKEIAVQAIKAGHDILLCPVDICATIEALKKAVEEGTISEEELDAHVLRVLRAKEKSMSQHKSSDVSPLILPAAHELKRSLYRAALTWHSATAIPSLDQYEHIHLLTNAPTLPLFANLLMKKSSHSITCHTPQTPEEYETFLRTICPQDLVILALYPQQSFTHIELSAGTHAPAVFHHYGPQIVEKTSHIITVLFDSPYKLPAYSTLHPCLIGYEADPDAQEAAADALCGTLIPRGILPISYS